MNLKKKIRAGGRGRRWGGRRAGQFGGFGGRGRGSRDSPCAQRRGVEAPSAGPSARQQAACERRRLCSWNETRCPAASASKPDTTSASASGYTNTPGWGHRRRRISRGARAPPSRAPPGLTVHRLRLRVAVGEPGPQAQAGAVGAGPDPGVGEGQRRPVGGAVQAGHGAWGGRPVRGARIRRARESPPLPNSAKSAGLRGGAAEGAEGRAEGGRGETRTLARYLGSRASAAPGSAEPGRGGLMINRRSGRRAVPPAAPLGAEGGVTAVPSPAPSRPAARTCRPPRAPRGCQLSEVARVGKGKMLWVGSKGLKGEGPAGCPQPSQGQQGRGGMGSRRAAPPFSRRRLN